MGGGGLMPELFGNGGNVPGGGGGIPNGGGLILLFGNGGNPPGGGGIPGPLEFY